MKYTCPNCGNKKAPNIQWNILELDNLDIMEVLVNHSELTHEQVGRVAFNLFYYDKEVDE